MHRYSVAQARQRFAKLLDSAERGQPVVIERRGVRFVVATQRQRPRRGKRKVIIDWVDPALESGEWTWTWGRGGLRFKGRRTTR
jgi:antitoxin (DNA-binding transcriptional repressor) of toxin-antitoxin stability system